MITIRELLGVWSTVTELDVTARQEDGKFLHEWLFGEDIRISIHQEEDIKNGKLTAVKKRINTYGQRKANGFTENAWSPILKPIPDTLLDAPIRYFTPLGSYGRSDCKAFITVELHPVAVEMLVNKGKG